MSDVLAIGPYTVGEKPAPLVYQFLDSSGTPIDLTGFTAEFHYRRNDDPSTVAVVPAVVSDAPAGKVTHVWTGTEYATPGTWQAEFWVGNGTLRYASRRLDASVRAPIGAPPSI